MISTIPPMDDASRLCGRKWELGTLKGNVNMRLKDKVTLITGGAAGIGLATAERFAEEGAKVVIGDVNQEAGDAAIKRLGADSSFHKVDVRDRKAVGDWIQEVLSTYGRVDVLVNNAGILRDSLLVKMKNGEVIKQMTEVRIRSGHCHQSKGCLQLHSGRGACHDPAG